MSYVALLVGMAGLAGVGCTNNRAADELVLTLDCPRKVGLVFTGGGATHFDCELTLTNHTKSPVVLDRALLFIPAALESPGENTRIKFRVEGPSATLPEEYSCLGDRIDPLPVDFGLLAPGETTARTSMLSRCIWQFRPNTEYRIIASYVPPPLPPGYRLPRGQHVVWTKPVTSNEAVVWIYDQSPGVP